jgi:hypothetical protein
MSAVLKAVLALLATGVFAQAAPAGPPDPDAPTVGASLDKSEAHVGDKLTLTVSAVARAGVAVTLPAKLDLGKLELLERARDDQRDLGDGRVQHRFVLLVTAYELGDLEVPPLELSYLDARGEVKPVSTQPVSLTMKSLVAEDEKQPEVQPIRPPRSAWVEDKRVVQVVRWALVVVGGALVLTIAALLIRRALRRRRVVHAGEAEPEGPRRPPDEVAMEKLKALRAAGGFSRDGYRPFTFALAEIVRAYLGARYGFDSLELTTTELTAELQLKAPHLCEPGSDVLRFLQETDLIKFANVGSTDDAAVKALDAAQAIVLSTAAPLEQVAQSISGPVRLPRPVDDDDDVKDAHG